MNLALWITAGLLALAFLGSGAVKLVKSRDDVVAAYAWAEDFSKGQIRLIGAAEVLGAVGLVLPPALGTMTVLTPVAAAGLALLMVGAVIVHLRRGETSKIGYPLVLFVLAAALCVLRAGPYAF
ncbi:DoxX family protein [Beutenbergia cavernae DSM 12333]|uniref:DoxX family protein n=1 Tax=Beutenbergia cavernae (strain ATCC BAA-8 / DSM 12333 / CCUG 43141 / JCM 11478 / NBRC 16432 / NCIMB 13614 / HKI 0122) TaxID=471853 RepID=C5BX04_BEUC1|nr:DoxX family protein [Beutenbergia cavernae]ACQ78679.1 DoxX family protein [Beutenbergia cavernae DSM 12333]